MALRPSSHGMEGFGSQALLLAFDGSPSAIAAIEASGARQT